MGCGGFQVDAGKIGSESQIDSKIIVIFQPIVEHQLDNTECFQNISLNYLFIWRQNLVIQALENRAQTIIHLPSVDS